MLYHCVDGKYDLLSRLVAGCLTRQFFPFMLGSICKKKPALFCSCGTFRFAHYLFARTRVNARLAKIDCVFCSPWICEWAKKWFHLSAAHAQKKKTIEFRIAFTFFSPTSPNRDFRKVICNERKTKQKWKEKTIWNHHKLLKSNINQAKNCFCITVLNWTINKFLPQIWLNAFYIFCSAFICCALLHLYVFCDVCAWRAETVHYPI